MSLSDAITITKQFGAFIADLSMLDATKNWLKAQKLDAMLHFDGWSRARLTEAFATLSEALTVAETEARNSGKEAEAAALALAETVERLGAEIRTLRDSKTKVEANVMALHEEAQRAQATIDERRGELVRLNTTLEDFRQLVVSIGAAFREQPA